LIVVCVHHQVSYYGIKSDAANLVLVGVRGSSTGRDWLEDINLYSEISLLQAFSLVSPMIRMWPLEATAYIVKLLSFCENMAYLGRSAYYLDIDEYIGSLRDEFPGYDVMVIGHSLGGATASTAGARTGVRSFSFEPPGVLYSHKKFGIKNGVSAIGHSNVAVVRDNDPVVLVDRQGGQVQNIGCRGSLLSAYCHMMHPITCHLMASCGALDRLTFDHWGGGGAYCENHD
jgi:putative lipase involved disintegration of autophagic bodies